MFLCGGVAGLLSETIFVPYQAARDMVIKNRFNFNEPPMGLYDGVKRIIRQDGVKGLYPYFEIKAPWAFCSRAVSFGLFENTILRLGV